jgi:hypothetical protein
MIHRTTLTIHAIQIVGMSLDIEEFVVVQAVVQSHSLGWVGWLVILMFRFDGDSLVTKRPVVAGEELNYDYALTETEISFHAGMKYVVRVLFG